MIETETPEKVENMLDVEVVACEDRLEIGDDDDVVEYVEDFVDVT